MTESCAHLNADWDWGNVQPSDELVKVPGYCPNCDTDVTRVYSFDEIMEI